VNKKAAKKLADAAEKICKYARFYMVCEGCESVVLYDTIFCPICDAYRFDKDPDRVKVVAKELAKRKTVVVLPNEFFDDQEFI